MFVVPYFKQANIMFIVYYYVRYQENPLEPHMTAIKNIFRYLRRITSHGLWYPSKAGFFAHADSYANLGGCGLGRKSMTRGMLVLRRKTCKLAIKEIYVGFIIN